jgi:hypothetical protein
MSFVGLVAAYFVYRKIQVGRVGHTTVVPDSQVFKDSP